MEHRFYYETRIDGQFYGIESCHCGYEHKHPISDESYTPEPCHQCGETNYIKLDYREPTKLYPEVKTNIKDNKVQYKLSTNNYWYGQQRIYSKYQDTVVTFNTETGHSYVWSKYYAPCKLQGKNSNIITRYLNKSTIKTCFRYIDDDINYKVKDITEMLENKIVVRPWRKYSNINL